MRRIIVTATNACSSWWSGSATDTRHPCRAATQKRVTAAEGTLRIVNASDDIREVFDITGLIDVFDVE